MRLLTVALILATILIAGCTQFVQPIHSTPIPTTCTVVSDCEEWCNRINCTKVACLGFWECVNNSCKWTCGTEEISKDDLCTKSGGTVQAQLCCLSSDDFPNTCLIGACGCSLENSHEVKVCDCEEGKCWDKDISKCVTS
jgi:hypothetical protein